MPTLSWNEVRERAVKFSRRWAKEESEAGSKQTFWNEFFEIFGRDRRTVAAFEVAVRGLRGEYNHIDLLWRGVLLVEHKSRGKSLAVAESQAFAYVADLARTSRFDEMPRYVIVSDFSRFALYDLEPDAQPNLPLFAGRQYAPIDFPLEDLHRYVRHFAFVKGERSIRLDPEDPANEKAYSRMCQLHDELEAAGFTGTDLERLLVRVLFCLFADDTEVFNPQTFETFVRQGTRDDGTDVGARLNELFEVLNTPEDRWSTSVRERFAGFRYINGELFRAPLRFSPFNRSTRDALLAACEFQWARVSPAVFGSLFQGILEGPQRRQLGAHYTSERDILKVVRSLFLDDLRSDFESIRNDASTRRDKRLEDFRDRLRSLKFFDPACGCGNFLIIGYRELRQLELELLRELHAQNPQRFLNIRQLVRVDVDQFYGIEIAEWPVRIAEVAMWLMDHQMNRRVSEQFGETFERLPLQNSPHIVQRNALRTDWNEVLPNKQCSFVLGNPPFVGKQFRTEEQQADMDSVWQEARGAGVLDYVTCWYRKAAEYVQGTDIHVAFVSTNSITQGEQVGILWTELFGRWRLKIQFAYRPFGWASEARHAAHVDVVIIGFGKGAPARRRLYEEHGGDGRITVTEVPNISPYLVASGDIVICKRTRPLCQVPVLVFGSMPNDGGHLLLSPTEKQELLIAEPEATKFIRRFVGSDEFINGIERWCLWINEVAPEELRRLPKVRQRIESVKEHRRSSNRATTRALAQKPWAFGEDRQPKTDYLLIPSVSSEKRRYIPIGFMSADVIASNLVHCLEHATLWHFAVLSSSMHMAWVAVVCGRLESRFRYSGQLVFNNYPWPPDITSRQKSDVEAATQAVLDVRSRFLSPRGSSTYADLYDPLLMPEPLSKAHAVLDRAVDRCYRSDPFRSDRERVEHLFALYEHLEAPLNPGRPNRRGRRRQSKVAAALATAPDEAEAELTTDSGHEGTVTKLPTWYLNAFVPRTASDGREISSDPLDIIYDQLEEMLTGDRIRECDDFIRAVADEPSRSSLPAMIGILTVTRGMDARLPSRPTLRTVVENRLTGTGKNALAILKGL